MTATANAGYALSTLEVELVYADLEALEKQVEKYEHKKAAVRKLREKYIMEKKKQLLEKNELLLKQD